MILQFNNIIATHAHTPLHIFQTIKMPHMYRSKTQEKVNSEYLHPDINNKFKVLKKQNSRISCLDKVCGLQKSTR